MTLLQISLIIIGFIAIMLLMILVSQYLQVKSIRDQVHFIARNDTNKKITFYGKSRGIRRLAGDINEIIDSFRTREMDIVRKDKEMRDTITNMSHDIRTPLTSLKGYFELLDQTDDPEEIEKYNSIIRERIDSLSDILETMFFYTKVNNTGYTMNITKMNFSEVLMQTMFSYFDEFEGLGIEPDINVDENVYAIADESATRRVIQNLIKNVMVHGDKSLSVSLKYINKRAVLEMSNGIKEGETPDPDKVFDRFYKGDTSRHINSSGIGLSVSKKLVDMMSGSISASVDNDRFTITLVLPGI